MTLPSLKRNAKVARKDEFARLDTGCEDIFKNWGLGIGD
jgi:hypothetical protein